MEDAQIIQLFLSRAERAIEALHSKYGRLCYHIAGQILPDSRDISECVNDTYLKVWNAIPPDRPKSLSAYLARITRNVALDRYAYNTADKRSSALTSAFEELEACFPAAEQDMNHEIDRLVFSDFINRFLRELNAETRAFFLRRYWYGESIRQIAESCHCSEEKVKTSLFRTRSKLKKAMEKEEICL